MAGPDTLTLVVIAGLFALVGIVFITLVAKRFRDGERPRNALDDTKQKQEALFKASFPELQPYFHPKQVLEFVSAWRARKSPPIAFDWTMPAGFGVAKARMGAAGEKGHPVELLDEAGAVLSRFVLQRHEDGAVIRLGPGKLTVGVRDAAVRYWHPEREFKWSRLKGWRVITALSNRPIESSDRGTSFSSDSSTSSSTATSAAAAAAGAAVVTGAGGSFDGGGSSSSWDAGGDSDARTSYLMFGTPEFLVARPLPSLVPVEDRRPPLRVLIASLARGGAERIVLDWLDAERRRARAIALAVLHPRPDAWRAPPGVTVFQRGAEAPEDFVAGLARRWADGPGAVSAHLVDDGLLAILWRAGIVTIPTVHNARAGWRNDPACWSNPDVPRAIACAGSVRDEMLAAGCRVPVTVIRHVPASHRDAVDGNRRQALREEWRIGEATLLVGVVGSFKPQKDFARAVEVLAELRRRRDAKLVILGGVLDRAQLGELDRTLAKVVALGLEDHVRLPGFVDPIGSWYAACDAMLSASRFEGFPMAVSEGLAAGLPVVALDAGGQREIVHERLALLPAGAPACEIAARLAPLPVRERLAAENTPRAPRLWSVACAWHAGAGRALDTLFVTANLNAGGAQRSLVNLARGLAPRQRLALAVCGETTQRAFADELARSGIRHFRPAPAPDPFAVSESLLAETQRTGCRTLCFWNADPRVKLLAAKFAPPGLRLVDVSPGAYAFDEMERERGFAATMAFDIEAYYGRLDTLVLKYTAAAHPGCRDVRVIPNGVAPRAARSASPPTPRFLVSGRIAPSKRLETILAAFASLCASGPAAELHIVGQAEQRHARYATEIVAAAAGLPVRFRGAQPELEHLDEDFTAAIVLGIHQGSPNAVLEAMAAGIPVIANASGGTGELVRDGETGWLIGEEAGAGELARAMHECFTRPDAALARAAAAREHVHRCHSIEAMAQRYAECLAPQAY
jgi:glycosyltransferase involved in cell wall biosynthesis